jgi:hypothetical protein
LTDLVGVLRDWRLGLGIMLMFGTAPGLVLRLLLCMYPKGHPRRDELLAELYHLRYLERPLFVAQQMETALFEGMSARRRTRETKGRPDLLHLQPMSHLDPSFTNLAVWINRTVERLRQAPQTVFVLDDPPFGNTSAWAKSLAGDLRWPLFEGEGVMARKRAAERVLRKIAQRRRRGHGVVVRLSDSNLDFADYVRRDAGPGAGAAIFIVADHSRPSETYPVIGAIGRDPDDLSKRKEYLYNEPFRLDAH